jgi:hypothetical protein
MAVPPLLHRPDAMMGHRTVVSRPVNEPDSGDFRFVRCVGLGHVVSRPVELGQFSSVSSPAHTVRMVSSQKVSISLVNTGRR